LIPFASLLLSLKLAAVALFFKEILVLSVPWDGRVVSDDKSLLKSIEEITI